MGKYNCKSADDSRDTARDPRSSQKDQNAKFENQRKPFFYIMRAHCAQCSTLDAQCTLQHT